MTLKVTASGAALGAEVSGVDLSEPLDDSTRGLILDAFLQHQAIFFRGQELSDEQLLQVSRLFGRPLADYRPRDYFPELDTEHPEYIDVISNVEIDGKPIGALGAGEVVWHSDTVPLPNSALLLYALEIPPSGGTATRIASTRAAYEDFPQALKLQAENRIVVHGRQDYNLLKQDGTPDIDPSQSPGPWFPLVRTHGDTGRKGFFLGRKDDGYIVDMTVADSNALLEEIWRHITRPEHVWEHHWQVGDLLVWDNRCTVHSRGPIADGRRRLHRTTVSGEWPSP